MPAPVDERSQRYGGAYAIPPRGREVAAAGLDDPPEGGGILGGRRLLREHGMGGSPGEASGQGRSERFGHLDAGRSGEGAGTARWVRAQDRSGAPASRRGPQHLLRLG
ncbi:hypothetical protein GCM10010462_10070 [Microbacterium dextranolyticum]